MEFMDNNCFNCKFYHFNHHLFIIFIYLFSFFFIDWLMDWFFIYFIIYLLFFFPIFLLTQSGNFLGIPLHHITEISTGLSTSNLESRSKQTMLCCIQTVNEEFTKNSPLFFSLHLIDGRTIDFESPTGDLAVEWVDRLRALIQHCSHFTEYHFNTANYSLPDLLKKEKEDIAKLSQKPNKAKSEARLSMNAKSNEIRAKYFGKDKNKDKRWQHYRINIPLFLFFFFLPLLFVCVFGTHTFNVQYYLLLLLYSLYTFLPSQLSFSIIIRIDLDESFSSSIFPSASIPFVLHSSLFSSNSSSSSNSILIDSLSRESGIVTKN